MLLQIKQNGEAAMGQIQKIKFVMKIPPYRYNDETDEMELRSLGELKYYVKPVDGWSSLGLEFKTSKELVDWVCSNLGIIETDNTRTYRQWVLQCYMRDVTKGSAIRWYIRATPEQLRQLKEPWRYVKVVSQCRDEPFKLNTDAGLKKLKTPKDPDAIADMLCRHIWARVAVPCDTRSTSYFYHWILFCSK
jgi:hypothetical protein